MAIKKTIEISDQPLFLFPNYNVQLNRDHIVH
jgi:hypothetical protein